ncbi:50S ribosomal protein L2 [Candidatus Woesebacteria bacterium]|nr:50S ribosomal protein L2 [Candidatus Woesebacteria bacterium]
MKTSSQLFTRQKPHASLSKILPKHAGRDSSGVVSVRHRGTRQKRYYRTIDFKRNKFDVMGRVETVEYDPNRNAHICLIKYADGEMRYIIAPLGIQVGNDVMSSDTAEISVGNSLPLSNIPVGIEIHNVELHPGQGAKMIRSAGLFATIVAKDGDHAHVKLSSGEVRKLTGRCRATIGRVGNVGHKDEEVGKAGRNILRGIRPTVRGVAQNPRSHPHGGGEGRSGEGMHPKTPWGKKARGVRTRNARKWTKKLIISQRPR